MVFEFLCSDCRTYTNKCVKGTRKKVLRGLAVACRPCQTLKLGRQAWRRQQEWEQKRRRYEQERQRQEQARRMEFESRHKLEAPWHPDENRDIQPVETLTITTGGMCFGRLDDIEFAASEPLRSVNDALEAEMFESGRPCHNIAVRNGQWNVYAIDTKLHVEYSDQKTCTVAFLVCHEDHDPVQECRYFLYHSVDADFGGAAVHGYGESHIKNCHRVGILKQNCYEWADCHQPGKLQGDPVGGGFQFVEYDNISNSVQTNHEGGEWTFGRIRVDNNKKAGVRSFLIFGDSICEAYFAGLYPNGPPEYIQNPLGYVGHDGEARREYDPTIDVPQFHDSKQRKITEFFQLKR